MSQTQPALPAFEEHAVIASAIKITNAGDGLSEALKAAPVALFHGDDVFVVLQGKVTRVGFDEDANGNLTRVHTVKTERMAQLDADTAIKAIQTAAEETERLKAEAAGQLALGAEQAAAERESRD